MASRKRSGKREVSAEEEALFAAVMRDARPLKETAKAPLPAPPKGTAPARRPSPPRSAPVAPAAAAPASLADMDKRNAQRLKRGQMPIEARLDLHGKTQEAAHRALERFIANAQAAGQRCVLVITGKGLKDKESQSFRFDGQQGVLREMVPRWLAEPTLRTRVVAWHPAQPKDGGTGALYVLVRRKRNT
jgi:DNA-nicking Smr family endonuclease